MAATRHPMGHAVEQCLISILSFSILPYLPPSSWKGGSQSKVGLDDLDGGLFQWK